MEMAEAAEKEVLDVSEEKSDSEVLDVSAKKTDPEDCNPQEKQETEEIIWVTDQYPEYPTVSKPQKPFVCNLPPEKVVGDSLVHPYKVSEEMKDVDMFPISEPSQEQVKESREFLDEIKSILKTDQNHIWVSRPNIFANSIERLNDESYQSDEMIRYLFDYRQDLFGIPKDEPSYVFFDGFFATMLVEIVDTFLDQEKKKANQAKKDGKEYSPRNVATYKVNYHKYDHIYQKQMKGRRIVDLETIIFLINEGRQHWAIIAVLPRYRKIEIFDLLRGELKNPSIAIWKFIDFHCQLESKTYDPSKWSLVWGRKCIPRQQDGHNCGFFAVFFAIAIVHRLSIYFLDSKKMDFLRVHLLLYFKGRPKKPHILIDVGSLFPTSEAARSKGKPKKDTAAATTTNQASQSNSHAEPNTEPTSSQVQSTYNLDSNEESGGDDDDPKKNKAVELPKSHAIDTPSNVVTQESKNTSSQENVTNPSPQENPSKPQKSNDNPSSQQQIPDNVPELVVQGTDSSQQEKPSRPQESTDNPPNHPQVPGDIPKEIVLGEDEDIIDYHCSIKW